VQRKVGDVVHRRSGIGGWGFKRPLAIFFLHGSDIRAFGPEGGTVSLDHVERLCPGAVERLVQRAPRSSLASTIPVGLPSRLIAFSSRQ
jgi:hypothetical protein